MHHLAAFPARTFQKHNLIFPEASCVRKSTVPDFFCVFKDVFLHCDHTPLINTWHVSVVLRHDVCLPCFSAFLVAVWCVGIAAGGDTSEAEPERPNPPAGGGKEHLAGAAGGGWGGTTQPGETAADSACSGTFVQFHTTWSIAIN